MITKRGLRTIAVAMLLSKAILAAGQTDLETCPVSVQESHNLAQAVCSSVADGEACVGNGLVTTKPVDGRNVQFANPGDRANLADIERFQVRTVSTDSRHWSTVVARLQLPTADGPSDSAAMLVFGDAVVWQDAPDRSIDNAGAEFLPATIQAAGGVIVRQDASADSTSVWQLPDGTTVSAIGRSLDGAWIRVLLPSPNGGAGWVYARFVAVEGGSELLPLQSNASPIPSQDTASAAPFGGIPAYRMESLPVDELCPEASDSGVLLQTSTLDRLALAEFNGIELQFAGAVFLTAQVGGAMAVHNLEGDVSMVINGQPVVLPTETLSEIPMDTSLSPLANASSPRQFDARLLDQLRYLPLRLLPRSFVLSSATVVDVSAGEAAGCPGSVQESYDLAALFCRNLSPDYACVGNVGVANLRSLPQPGIGNLSFALPGDISNLRYIGQFSQSVSANPARIWPVSVFEIEANTSGGATATASMLVLGEVDLTNLGATISAPGEEGAAGNLADLSAFTARIQVAGSLSVRDEPRVNSDAIALVDYGVIVPAFETSVDRQWIRIQTPEGVRGWVVALYVLVDQGIDALPIVGGQTGSSVTGEGADEMMTYDNLQVFNFSSRDNYQLCGEVPPAGILVQSPSDMIGALHLTINGADLAITGTAYFTADNDTMVVFSLEGAVKLVAQSAPPEIYLGEQLALPLSGGQFDNAASATARLYSYEDSLRLATLPTQLLPRSIEVFLPQSDEVAVPTDGAMSDEATSADDMMDETNDERSADEPLDETIAESGPGCIISAGGLARNIRQGPGTNYSVVDVLQVGQSVEGQSQKRGTHGLYWYRTERGWIRFDAGETTAACERLPLYWMIENEFAEEEEEPPPLFSDILGDVCAQGGAVITDTIRGSGNRFVEMGGLWTGRAGTSATFTAQIPYFHDSFGNVISFTTIDGGLWLGSLENSSFPIYFSATQNFRVRVSGLLGDAVSLHVSC